MRILSVYLLLSLCVAAFSASPVLASNASRSGGDQLHMVALDSRQQALIETTGERPNHKTVSNSTSLGFFMSPGILLETSSYDLQHNSHMARQVAVGADGRVHFIWTHLSIGSDLGSRAVHYRSFKNVGAGGTLTAIRDVSGTLGKTPGRFCALDVAGSRALLAYHYLAAPATLSTSALDGSSGGGSFTGEDTPSGVVNCQGIACGGAFTQNYNWPVIAADVDGSGRLVVHMAAQEGQTAAVYAAIAYFRGVSSGTSLESGMFGTCGTFIDSTVVTSYDIAADPNSDKVAIVYHMSRQVNRENSDLGYRLSTDLGVTWAPPVNITNIPTSAKERVGDEAIPLFGTDGCLHILYIGNVYDSVANTVAADACKLYHWSSCNPTCRSLVLDAPNQDLACQTPSFEYNISRISLSQCIDTSSAVDDTMLYAVYCRQLGTSEDPDCSDGGYSNADLYVSTSSSWGETWGAPVNLSNTKTNNCTAGNCADETFSTSARYNVDSLRIEYMEDLDAGCFQGNEGSTVETNNPVRFLSYRCVAMEPYQQLSSTPASIRYPFHATVGNTASETLILTNAGNEQVNWTSTILPGNTCPVTINANGTVPAGCTNSASLSVTVGPMASEGLFHATISFAYQGGAKTLEVPIDFYVFNSWFVKEDVILRTASNKMIVNNVAQAANSVLGSGYTYYADASQDFVADASLIVGHSATNLSWRIFESGLGIPGSPTNNYGWLYALSHTTIDSTSFPYRIASANGTNRDSTIAYDVDWYACKHVDSSDFYVGHFEIYKGTNNPSGTVTGLTVAFGVDPDVPSDTGSDNTIGYDATRQMIYLQGQYTAARQQGFFGVAAYREDGQPIKGGVPWGNQEQVYPLGGFQADSVWKYMQLVNNSYTSIWVDSVGDMSVIMVVEKNLTVTPTSRFSFDVVLSGKRAETNTTGLAGLTASIDQAKAFICKYIAPTAALCATACTSCGDANSDGAIDISDAVFLISHIFTGGAAPGECNYPKGKGDANGDQTVDISDAVYLISRIFTGGPPPHCFGM